MSNFPANDDDDEPGFFEKFRVPIILFALVAIAAGTWFAFFNKAEKPKRKSTPISMVSIMPPPPPPPTPPPTPPPPQPEQPKEETKQEFVEETKPEAAPEPESAPDDAPLGTNLEGPGSDSFGLAKGGGGGMIGGTGKGKGGGGSKYGLYAGQVQSRVADALRSHKKTRSASMSVKVRIWVDSTGRITNAKLSGSSGDASVDRAICDEILTGLQLQSPPPEGMPMPVVMRISASRPN